MEDPKWFNLDQDKINEEVGKRYSIWRSNQRDLGHIGISRVGSYLEAKKIEIQSQVIREMNERVLLETVSLLYRPIYTNPI
jgi:hypothetical protein